MGEMESVNRLLDDFRAMTNICLRVIRKKHIKSIRQAHSALYARLKKRYPNYNTAIIARAYRVALQMPKNLAKHATRLAIRLSKLNSKFLGNAVMIGLVRGVCVTIPLKVTSYQQRYIDGWRRGEFTIGEFIVTPLVVIVPFTRHTSRENNPKATVAFDTNERQLTGITSSDEIVHVDTSELKRLHDTYYKKRCNIQRKLTSKPRLQHQLLRRIGRREHNRVLDTMHTIAKKVATEYAGYHMVLENLTGIRQSNSIRGRRIGRRLNSWNFDKLQTLIDYKMRLMNGTVEYVNPYNTSRVCSSCNSIIEGKNTTCSSCGLDRHVNAARNILARSRFPKMWRGIGSAEGSLMRLVLSNEQWL